ncbi:WAT1-related protein At4g01440-like isoform X2 [Lycium ferocissimum]|uniref:WAT1-related protein At4g01440-like isoform X2 n=1 Tax=Lycium ferocissimum TaxID=112874 RepID=UPI0028166BF4|nr:WAT1-related protein At4g01440-like isoform X2 [Lycium ferocissimum]
MGSYVEWYPIFIMLAIDFAFAISNILLKKIILDGMNHLVFITYRQSISTIFLAPVAFFVEKNTRPKLTSQILCNLFLSAIVGASLTQYLFLLGIEYTSATFACAFVNMVTVITFLMALPFGLETINIKHGSGIAKAIGTLICVGGAFILTFYKGIPLIHFSEQQSVSPSSEGAISSSKIKERWIFGSLALFAGTLLWSSWFLLQSFIGKKYPCKYSSTVIMTFFSAIQAAILTLSIDRRPSIWIPKEKIDMLSIIYASGINRFRNVFCGNVMVCQEEGSSLHCSIQSSCPSYGSLVRCSHSARTTPSRKCNWIGYCNCWFILSALGQEQRNAKSCP